MPAHRTITGFSNPTVKFLRSLRDKKHRRREKRFLAEGLRLLTDAREGGKLPEMLVMATGREQHPLLDGLVADVAAAGGEVVEMGEDILAKVTGKAALPARRAPAAGSAGPRRTGINSFVACRCKCTSGSPRSILPGVPTAAGARSVRV